MISRACGNPVSCEFDTYLEHCLSFVVCWFVLMFYAPINNFSVMSECKFACTYLQTDNNNNSKVHNRSQSPVTYHL